MSRRRGTSGGHAGDKRVFHGGVFYRVARRRNAGARVSRPEGFGAAIVFFTVDHAAGTGRGTVRNCVVNRNSRSRYCCTGSASISITEIRVGGRPIDARAIIIGLRMTTETFVSAGRRPVCSPAFSVFGRFASSDRIRSAAGYVVAVVRDRSGSRVTTRRCERRPFIHPAYRFFVHPLGGASKSRYAIIRTSFYESTRCFVEPYTTVAVFKRVIETSVTGSTRNENATTRAIIDLERAE